MRAFDFNKSALELSFLVVARGFVLSWVSCCLSSLSLSLSLSFGEARRAYARAAGRYSEKAKLNKEEEKKKKKNDDDDDSKEE
jgi:hypothetical protein